MQDPNNNTTHSYSWELALYPTTTIKRADKLDLKKKIITWDRIQRPLSMNFYILTMSDEVRMNNINSFKQGPNKMNVNRSIWLIQLT